MPYPQQTFPFRNMAALLNYINTYIVTNGVGEITGVNENDIGNALGEFTLQSILNNAGANTLSLSSAVTTNQPVNYITVAPSSITFIDDGWFNEYIFINTTIQVIPFISTPTQQGYYDINKNFQTTIAGKGVLHIYKSANGLWVQGEGTTSINPIEPPLVGVVGQSGFPVAGTSTYQNNALIGLGGSNGGKIQFNLAEQIYSNFGNNQSFNFNNTTGTITLLNGNTFYEGDSFYCNLIQ